MDWFSSEEVELFNGKFLVEEVDLSRLLGIPYDAKRHPESVPIKDFLSSPMQGSNCELLVLGALALGGFDTALACPRAKELWEDKSSTEMVLIVDRNNPAPYIKYFINGINAPREAGRKKPFDIFFFWPPGAEPASQRASEDDLKRLHLGLYIGNLSRFINPVLHNPKGGYSDLWNAQEFFNRGYKLFGVKRPISTAA